MRYYLTDEQFEKLWESVSTDSGFFSMYMKSKNNREKYWNENLRDKYKLLYSETTIKERPAVCVIGQEDRINWFLLQF